MTDAGNAVADPRLCVYYFDFPVLAVVEKVGERDKDIELRLSTILRNQRKMYKPRLFSASLWHSPYNFPSTSIEYICWSAN